ncbi:MAG TPA: hypothetical protein VKZ72_07490 [Acidimicrobiales bacterium]|nr:hypothetical protein [Acidimicrobiales bacterium]
MARRRFDPVSFVLGCVTVAAGVVVLTGGELIEEARWLAPATLIGVGVAVLVRLGRRHAGSAGAADGAGTAGDG